VAQPVGVQRLDGPADRAGAAQLTGVRDRQQAGVASDAEGLGEQLGRPLGLVVGQPEADHPRPARRRPGEAAGDPGEGLRLAGCRVRLAATTSAMPTPVAASAVVIASSTTSTVACSPPSRAAYDDGSTCTSTQPEPAARSSSAISAPAGAPRRDRASSRAASYSRWKRDSRAVR
jgi:hypothetical protein